MDSGLEVALVGATVALASASLGIYSVRVAHRMEEQRDVRTHEQLALEVMQKYRDPLLQAAFDLQSRLYNILQLDFMDRWQVHGTPSEREYAVENTLHVIGEYFGWVEILRLEVRFLDLHDMELNRRLAEKIDRVSEAFLDNELDSALRVFRGEQRAIGEVMIANLEAGSGERSCIGYATFMQKRDDPAVGRWFAKLREDLEVLAQEPGQHQERLILLQRSLIDLIRFLDPDRVHFPKPLVAPSDPSAKEGPNVISTS